MFFLKISFNQINQIFWYSVGRHFSSKNSLVSGRDDFFCLIYSPSKLPLLFKSSFISPLKLHFSSSFFLPVLLKSPLAKTAISTESAVDWLTCECVSSCAITRITATSPTDRSISHTLGCEFQKSSCPGCFQQGDESLLIFPKCLRTTVTPHTDCCLGTGPAHSHYKASCVSSHTVDLESCV